MPRDRRYDISGTGFTQLMDAKTTDYNTFIRKAERANRDNKGNPSKDEATFYYNAAKICEEIMNMNLSQRHVYEQWKGRKLDCEDEFKRITDALLPPAPEPEPVPEPAAKPDPQKIPSKKSAAPAKTAKKSSGNCPEGLAQQHATKEISVDDIESWFPEVPEKGFEGIIGRTEVKERLINEAASFGWEKLDSALDINPVQCYLLYGPPGTGKTHLVKSFAGELRKKGFNYMQLAGSQIHSPYVGIAEKIACAALSVAIDASPCLIFIDEVDNLLVSKSGKVEGHEARLTTAFREAFTAFTDSGKRLIFMGATNHPGRMDEPMLDRFTLLKIPLPAEEDRLGYFDRMVNTTKDNKKTAKIFLEEGFTIEEMAEATENHSYRDLNRLKNSMLARLKAQAMQEYRILDENGKVDLEASDEQASAAIHSGDIVLTRAIFEQIRKENPPSDKTEIRQELMEFEKRVSGGFE